MREVADFPFARTEVNTIFEFSLYASPCGCCVCCGYCGFSCGDSGSNSGSNENWNFSFGEMMIVIEVVTMT